VLVPTRGTRAEHIVHARETAPDLLTAVRALIGTDRGRPPPEHAWPPATAGVARSRQLA
jgi:hypothetical protein